MFIAILLLFFCYYFGFLQKTRINNQESEFKE